MGMSSSFGDGAHRGDRPEPHATRATRAALDIEERRELLLLYANDVILLFDEQYRVVDFNDRALEAYGYSREEFRGLTLGDLREGSQPIALDARMAEVRRRGGMVFGSVSRRKDGSTFPVETSVRAVKTSAGQYYHTIVRDISERRAAEHELGETLHRMKQAERLASLGHWRVDLPGGQFRPSDELLQIVGASRPPADMFGEEAESYVHPDDRGKREKILEALRDGQPVRYAWRALRPDGEIRYLEGSAEPVFGDAGRVVSVFGVTQDVTERAETTAALRQSEERVRGVFATMMEGFAYCRMLYDEEGRRDDFEYLEVNPAFAELTGIEGAVGRRVTELIPSIKDLNPELLDIYGEVAETGMPAEFDIDFAPLDKWLHVSATRPREGEFVAVFYDITERKEAERLARESGDHFRMALRNAPVSVAMQDTDLRYVWAYNQRSARPEAIIGKRDADIFTAEEAAHLETVKRRVLDEDVEMREELWLGRPGGRMFLAVNFEPIHDGAGKVVGVGSATVDLTPMKLAEQALFDNRAKLETALASMTDAVFISDAEGNFLDFNDAFATFHRFTSKEECLRSLAEYPDILEVYLDSGELAPLDQRAVPRALRGEVVVDAEYRLRRKDTGEVWVGSYSFAPIRDESGAIVGSVVAARDVSDRKKAERDLEESEERFRSLFEHSPIAVFFGAPDDGSITAANPAACEMFGYTEAELVGMGRVGILDTDDPRLGPGLRARAETRKVHGVELTAIRGDGRRFPVEVDSIIVPTDPPRSFVMMRDITERLEMERALRQSEAAALETVARLSRSQQLGRMGDWEWDLASGEVRWSEEIRRIYGVGLEFATNFETIVPMTHPADAEANLRGAQAILDDPDRSSGVLTFRIVRPDGAVRHIFQTLAVDRTPEGEPVRVFGIMQDVTELRETELALLQSERRFRRFYDASLVGVAFWTAEGSISDANDRFLDMLGYTREDLYAGAVDWAAMTPPEYAARDEEALEELQATGRNAVPYEKDYYTKDGARLPVLITAAALDEEATSGILLVLDVTEQKRAELDLRRLNLDLEDRVRRRTADLEAANEELESFSYSVSHDLRAPLRHIAGFAELLRGSVGDHDDEDTGHFIDVITHAANDMGILIDDLLQFSRVGRAEMHVAPVNMEQLVREVLDVAGSNLGDRRVEVTVGEIAPAPGDRTLLRQVWANLIGNAYKYSRPRDPAVIEIGSRQDDGEVVYWVRDNGVGFDLQYAERLFHVFERLHRSEEFEGTGIGLANVQRIVGRHDGRCWAEAEEGKGATFFFSLPNG